MPSSTAAAEHVPPPGIDLRRKRPRLSFELLGCAVHGHVLVGLDADHVSEEDRTVVRDAEGRTRWHRCLRCDAWTLMPRPDHPARAGLPARDEIALPSRGRPLKRRYILRLIALTRAVNFLVIALVAAGAIAVVANLGALQEQLMSSADAIQLVFGGQAVDELRSALSGGSGPLWLIAAGLVVLAAFEATEGIGLWLGARWAEYLTFVLTTLLLIPEILQLTSSVSPGTIIALVVNVAVVVYLLFSQRLFGLRGGGAALAAEHEHDVSWAALERRLPV